MRDITTILIGTKGRIVIEGVFNWAPGRIQVLTDNEVRTMGIAQEDPFVPELDAFIDHIHKKTPLKMQLEESIRAISLTVDVMQVMRLV